MTGGGPGTTTETMSFYAGRVFGVANFPYAATLSLITLIVLNLGVTLFIRAGAGPAVIGPGHRHQVSARRLAWAGRAGVHVPARLVGAGLVQALHGDLQHHAGLFRLRRPPATITRSRCSGARGSRSRSGGRRHPWRRLVLLFDPLDPRQLTVAVGATVAHAGPGHARGLRPVALPLPRPAARAVLRPVAAHDAADRGGDPALLHVPRSRPARHPSRA